MSKRKTFGLSMALQRGLTETVAIAENSTSLYRNTVIPLSRLVLDPQNPRQLRLTVTDVITGLKTTDPDYQNKKHELTSIENLARTIDSQGLLQPIVVFKNIDKYQIIAGHRRILAYYVLKKTEIEGRVFNKRPSVLDLKLMQWIENNAREDLSLHERVENIVQVTIAYQQDHGLLSMTNTVLAQLTGLSASQAAAYLAVIRTDDDIRDAIQAGRINSLDKAALIVGMANAEGRQQMIIHCEQGATLKQLRKILAAKRNEGLPAKRGRPKSNRLELGHTTKPAVIQTIVEAVLTLPAYKRYRERFPVVNWQDSNQASRTFKALIKLLEKREG